jgi:hypothetical protein
MGRRIIRFFGAALFCCWSVFVFGQNEDCTTAIVICSDGTFSFSATGNGIDDFANPNNDEGCIGTFEDESAWYYFAFADDMPANSVIEFTIEPSGGLGEDFDFAIYGANLTCDSLGSPVRCSFANFLCTFCPQTGLGMGATDTSEDGATGDGFVAPMVVQPGEGFYLLLNTFGNPDGFELTWGGSAAPFLRCDVTPGCPGFSVDAGADQNICAGDTLFLSGMVSGTTGMPVFEWTDTSGLVSTMNDPAIADPFLVIPSDQLADDYALVFTVTDGACVQADTVVITVVSSPDVSIFGNTLLCQDSIGVLFAGAGFSSYLWSTGSMTPSIPIFSGGTYSVTVTNAAGCIGVDSIVVQELVVDVTIAGDSTLCDEAFSTLIAPPGFLSYEWSTGITSQLLTVSDPGEYSVTVIDVNGCAGADTIMVEEFPIPPVSILGDTVFCAGESTTLEIDPVYTNVDWSTGAFQPSITVDQPGMYSVMIMDDNGCENVDTVQVIEQPLPLPQISGDLTICPEDTTILSTVDAYDSYFWSTGESTPMISVFNGGPIDVTVIDSFGCEGMASAIVSEVVPSATVAIIADNDVICTGQTATLEATGGVFTDVVWSDGTTGPLLTVTTPGTYAVSAMDSNGCISVDTLEIGAQPGPQPILPDTLTHCENSVTTLNPGTGFASYLWSTGSISPTLSVAIPGEYSVTVTNADGCTGIDTVFLEEVPLPGPGIMGDLSICSGETSTLVVTTPFQDYLWSTGATTPGITVDSGGFYEVSVTNFNGCEGSFVLFISELPGPDLEITGDSILCGLDATVLTATGTFNDLLWSNGSTDMSISVDTAGIYTATATNSFLCSVEDTVEIVQVPAFDLSIDGTFSFCSGTSTTLSANPGFGDFVWSDGSTADTLSVSDPGEYSVTVSVGGNCAAADTVMVTENPVPNLDIIGNTLFCVGDSTVFSVVDTFATYAWSTGATTPMVTVSDSGTYVLSVTDGFGCTAVDSTTLAFYASPVIDIQGDTAFCADQSTMLTASAGFSQYEWTGGTTDPMLEVTTPGLYNVTGTDGNGCQASAGVEVVALAVPDVAILSGDTSFCAGDTAVLTATTGLTDYLWSDGSTGPTLAVTTPGMYTLEGTAANGCIAADTVLVTENPLPNFMIDGVLAICSGDSTTLVVPDTFATYQWTTGAVAPDLLVTAAGDYGVTVSNEFGCFSSASVNIDAVMASPISIQGDTAFCEGTTTILTASAGFADYTWSTGAGGAMVTIDSSGTYSVVGTDNNGCLATDTITTTLLPLPAVAIDGDTLICANETATLTATPGLASYVWSDSSTGASLITATGGDYSVTATDMNGCIDIASWTLAVQPLPQPDILGDTLFCVDSEQTLSLGTSFPTQEWSTMESGPSIFIDQPGNYAVTVTDAFGCQGSDSIAVAWFAETILDITGDAAICPEDSTTLFSTATFQNYLWSDGSSADSLIVSMPGTYQLTATDNNGCIDSTTFEVAVFATADPVIDGGNTLCSGRFIGADCYE